MPQNNSQINQQTRQRTKQPQMYDVILHNDDVTTMDFVVYVLQQVFFMSTEKATNLMLDVHNNGFAIVGTYTYDIALSKAQKTTQMANDAGFPLRVSIAPTKDLPF